MLQLSFIIITFLSLILFFYGTGRDKKILFTVILWLTLVAIVSSSGYFLDTKSAPPRFLFILLPALCLSVLIYKKLIGNKTDIRYLLAIHSLRLPVELVLYQLFIRKQVPVEMTFEGWNFDIIMGLSAIVMLAYALLSGKRINTWFLLVWNFAGLAFLTTIVTIAILSSPFPFQQLAFEQANVAILQFPFVYLPACVVPLVYMSHFLMMNNNNRHNHSHE